VFVNCFVFFRQQTEKQKILDVIVASSSRIWFPILNFWGLFKYVDYLN
jgi:hypothetical protein